MQVLGPSPPHPSSLPNPVGGTLLLAGLTPNDVLDLLSAYDGPYIIYTSEIIGCICFSPQSSSEEKKGVNNARHIQVFENKTYV